MKCLCFIEEIVPNTFLRLALIMCTEDPSLLASIQFPSTHSSFRTAKESVINLNCSVKKKSFLLRFATSMMIEPVHKFLHYQAFLILHLTCDT